MPLLLQIHLHHELTHKVSRKASVKDTAILDATDNNGNLLLNPSDNNEFMNKFHKQRLIHELLSKLSEKQRNVIIATIINDYSLDDFAKDNGISYTAAFRLRERALELMRQEL
jgi:DNA-directed RNA polymerase specialized sigma subunit